MTPAEYNRQLPAPGAYARCWKVAMALAPETPVTAPGWVVGLPGWPRQSTTAGEVQRQSLRALERRINARAGVTPPEPREGDTALFRDSRAVRNILTRRLRVYQFESKRTTARFGHLLASREED